MNSINSYEIPIRNDELFDRETGYAFATEEEILLNYNIFTFFDQMKTKSSDSEFIFDSESIPYWLPFISTRLKELTSMEVNWDGEGAPPVNEAIAKFAINLLLTIHTPIMKKPPAIVPLFNGDLQIEWRDQNFYIVVHVIEPKRMVAMRSITAEKRREYEKVSTDFALIKRWVVELFEKHNPERKTPFITMIRQKKEANILPISDRSQTELSIGNHFVNSMPSEFPTAA